MSNSQTSLLVWKHRKGDHGNHFVWLAGHGFRASTPEGMCRRRTAVSTCMLSRVATVCSTVIWVKVDCSSTSTCTRRGRSTVGNTYIGILRGCAVCNHQTARADKTQRWLRHPSLRVNSRKLPGSASTSLPCGDHLQLLQGRFLIFPARNTQRPVERCIPRATLSCWFQSNIPCFFVGFSPLVLMRLRVKKWPNQFIQM